DGGDRARVAHERRIEGYLIYAIEDSGRGFGPVWACDRIDVDHDDVAGLTLIDEREDGGIAHIAAVPIGLSIDFHGLEQQRQTGRCHYRVRRDLGIAEEPHLASAHVGGIEEELDGRALAQTYEIHRLLEDVAQRIEIHGIE